MSSENRVGNTGDLVASYSSSLGLGIPELAIQTGLSEEYLGKIVNGKRQFSRNNLVAIIEVLEKRMEEAEQSENFTFEDKRELLESAGFGLVAGYINTDQIPATCVGGTPLRADED